MQIEKGSTKDREIFLSRMLKAPVELVWEVWTTPDHIASWGGDPMSSQIQSQSWM
jgi:uncharacterized protein YndB with AHSA1/START domain